MSYKIMYKYAGLLAEEIDSADTEEEAEHLMSEYRLAFGLPYQYRLWIEKNEV